MIRQSGSIVELIPIGDKKTLIVSRPRRNGETFRSNYTHPQLKVIVNIEFDYYWIATAENTANLLFIIERWSQAAGVDDTLQETYLAIAPYAGVDLESGSTSVNLYNVPQGDWNFRLRHFGHLSREITSQTVGAGVLTLDFTNANSKALMPGDCSGSNTTGGEDYDMYSYTIGMTGE